MIRDRHQAVVVFPGIEHCWAPAHGATQAIAKSVGGNEALALKPFDDEGLPDSLPDTNPHAVQQVDARAVFAELVELLEDYAPFWYTDERRERTQAALGTLKG